MSVQASAKKKLNTVDFQSLIINNPDKQTYWKRLGFFLLTLFFWGLWFYLWTPLPGLFEKLITHGLSGISFQPASYVLVFFSLLLALASWQIIWLNYNLRRFKTRGRRSNKQVLSNRDLGGFFTVDKQKLGDWQQSKCLVVMHDQMGEIQEVDENDFFSFAPSLPKNINEALDFKQFHIMLLPRKKYRQLFRQVGHDFDIIMKVLCATFNIRYQKSKLAKKYLMLSVAIPANYNVENVVKQIKLASAAIIKKKYAKLSDTKLKKARFWRSEQLVRPSKLGKHEMQDFFNAIVPNKSKMEPQIPSKDFFEPVSFEYTDSMNGKDDWQHDTVLTLKNNVSGQYTDIDVDDFFVCAALPVHKTNTECDRSRFYVVLLPESQHKKLFVEIGTHFKNIMKVLSAIYNVSLVDCIVKQTYLTITFDLPETYNPEEWIIRLKKASSIIIEKKYATEDNKAQYTQFWRDKMLLTTPDQVDFLLKAFILEIK